jgi:hypothetical protein
VPKTKEERLIVASDFVKKLNVPNCVGAMDGKYISMQAPIASGSDYINYKKFFSIVLLAVVDASYNFLYAVLVLEDVFLIEGFSIKLPSKECWLIVTLTL